MSWIENKPNFQRNLRINDKYRGRYVTPERWYQGDQTPRVYPGVGGTAKPGIYSGAYSAVKNLFKYYGIYKDYERYIPDYYIEKFYYYVSNPKEIFKSDDFWKILNAIQKKVPKTKVRPYGYQQHKKYAKRRRCTCRFNRFNFQYCNCKFKSRQYQYS